MLRLEEIDFSYTGSKEVVLKDFSLSMETGSTLAILGSSGCGKSTILRIIAGLEKPNKGKVFIDDRDMSLLPPDKRNVGFVFQDYALFPHMTVYKNIEFGLPKSKENKNRVVEVATLVGVEDYLERYPHELSGGQRQRVALARAIAYQPSLLLLDEPFSNLDTDLKDHIRSDLKEIIERTNITTIIVTHDKEDAEVLAQKTVIL